MPQERDERLDRQRQRAAARKKRLQEQRRMQMRLMLAAVLLVLCGIGIYTLTQGGSGGKTELNSVTETTAYTEIATKPKEEPTTTIHIKQWAKYRWQFHTLTEAEALRTWVREMIALAEAEIQNAEATIPLVEADSRLGWEPSMEYIGDARHLRWKIKQTRQVIEDELKCYLKIIDKTL